MSNINYLDYKEKYLKYKIKYINLKQSAGSYNRVQSKHNTYEIMIIRCNDCNDNTSKTQYGGFNTIKKIYRNLNFRRKNGKLNTHVINKDLIIPQNKKNITTITNNTAENKDIPQDLTIQQIVENITTIMNKPDKNKVFYDIIKKTYENNTYMIKSVYYKDKLYYPQLEFKNYRMDYLNIYDNTNKIIFKTYTSETEKPRLPDFDINSNNKLWHMEDPNNIIKLTDSINIKAVEDNKTKINEICDSIMSQVIPYSIDINKFSSNSKFILLIIYNYSPNESTDNNDKWNKGNPQYIKYAYSYTRE